MTDVFRGYGAEVSLAERDDFLKVMETLTRVGIPEQIQGNSKPKLIQLCHILHKKSRYAIVHYKELLELDGVATDFSVEDEAVRNTVALLLDEWGLVDVVDQQVAAAHKAPMSLVKVIHHKDKDGWELQPKYKFGASRPVASPRAWRATERLGA